LVAFLPEEERNLRRDGIHFCNIRYWSDALSADVGHSKEKLLIKYDPRDLSRIFVRRPSGRFVEARYRDLWWPPITLAEQRAVMRLLRAHGRREVDEALLFKTAHRQREIVDTARRQTVAMRKSRELRPLQTSPESKGGNLSIPRSCSDREREAAHAAARDQNVHIALLSAAADRVSVCSGTRIFPLSFGLSLAFESDIEVAPQLVRSIGYSSRSSNKRADLFFQSRRLSRIPE
jgi:hypothetical protein